MFDLKIKILPSLEKCFLDDDIEKKTELPHISMLKNERLSFQLAIACGDPEKTHCAPASLTVSGALAGKLLMRKVDCVPVSMPIYHTVADTDYLRREAGVYPDLLTPCKAETPILTKFGQLRSYFFTVEDKDGIDAGEYTLTFTVSCGEITRTAELAVAVIDAMLPEQELICTNWFHNDCIASYYDCEIFSDKHWELIGNYMNAASKCGVNMILTPVLTPPLDTAVGGERPTVQLVDVILTDGVYSFNYEKLDRYVKLALENGMKYFEISHLFTQWGAKYAPKVMAAVDGEYKRIFGWDTDGVGEEYTAFIRAFLTGLVEHLKLLGIDKQCYFHISDEPSLEHLEGYMKAKAIVSDILDGYVIMDALSKFEFYENGAVEHPIPANDHIEPFLEAGVPELWTYYCCAQHTKVSNRFLAMPGQRTRILGAQLFKYNIAGFLQWGFNFWYSRWSLYQVDPYVETCGDCFVPAGDAFVVYPGKDGKALYTLHGEHFYEALQDLRAMRLLEERIGHDAVVALIEEGCPEPMTFKSYPRTIDYLLSMRERINAALAK